MHSTHGMHSMAAADGTHSVTVQVCGPVLVLVLWHAAGLLLVHAQRGQVDPGTYCHSPLSIASTAVMN